jgi:hypothetical protein
MEHAKPDRAVSRNDRSQSNFFCLRFKADVCFLASRDTTDEKNETKTF